MQFAIDYMNQKELKDEVYNHINYIRVYKQIIIPAKIIGSRGEGKQNILIELK